MRLEYLLARTEKNTISSLAAAATLICHISLDKNSIFRYLFKMLHFALCLFTSTAAL